MPTQAEWELAAGHMPKDADMNCGENKGTTPVAAYAQTISASGAIDMWGNVWKWTSTPIIAQTGKEKGQTVNEIKGGSWYSHRTNCRTENRS
ncbi:MAG: SUMF1/EgtB/PvdO family nonheme iron enzyme [Alphaproteobacteria bacterium]|nr:SUMF1/EgtB/PvdO family nonheme iron enzyme [Alphaproteobacteria bacterium]